MLILCFVPILVCILPKCALLVQLLTSLGLSFLIYKMRIRLVPASQSCDGQGDNLKLVTWWVPSQSEGSSDRSPFCHSQELGGMPDQGSLPGTQEDFHMNLQE